MDKKYYYLQTIREFVSAFLIFMTWSYFAPNHYLNTLIPFFLSVVTIVPMTKLGVLLANLLSAVFIFTLGMVKKEFVSLFVVLNGAALGLIFGMYRDNFSQLSSLMLPHALFETPAIILFCVQVKLLNFAKQNYETTMIQRAWMSIIYICIPLFLLGFWLESFKLS